MVWVENASIWQQGGSTPGLGWDCRVLSSSRPFLLASASGFLTKQEDDFCSSYDRRVPTERMNVGEFWAFGHLDPATDLQISTALKSKFKYFELFILFFPKITGLKLTLLSSKWSTRYTGKAYHYKPFKMNIGGNFSVNQQYFKIETI